MEKLEYFQSLHAIAVVADLIRYVVLAVADVSDVIRYAVAVAV